MGCCRRVLMLVALATYVASELTWIQDMNRLNIQEPPGNDFEKLAGNKEYETNWTNIYVTTLSAVDSATGTSDGIIYGFDDVNELADSSQYSTSDYFRVEKTTGLVYMYGTKLDYDNENQRNIRVIVIAKKGSDVNKRTVTCVLTDFNDNSPKLVNDSQRYQLKENTDPGPDGLLLASNLIWGDVDLKPTNGKEFIESEIQYCIISGIQVDCRASFRLQPILYDEKKFVGNFYVLQELDFEAGGTIQVQIRVTDGYFVTITDITITVQDEQDLPPLWKRLPKIVLTTDGTQPRELSVIVEAEDQDTQKRPIYYTLEPTENLGIPIQSVFTINPTAGVISNIVELDLEDETLFRNYAAKQIRDVWDVNIKGCEIIETTGLPGPDCTPVGVVTIQIQDVNDNAPLHVNRTLYIYEIFEDEPTGTDLNDPPIVIFDRDTDLYNKHLTVLETPSEEFRISGTPNNPVIQIKNSDLIDFDMGPKQYNLTLRTYDIENNALHSIAYVIIYIKDVNDNRPQFSQPSYSVFIPEDSQVGFNVERIVATDIDSDDFGTSGIRYSLIRVYTDLFNIDSNTGQVTVAFCNNYGVRECLDYDYQPRTYVLSVRATDTRGANIGNSNTITLSVTLTNVNDNPPIVGDYEREIVEGQREFDPHLNVVASDLDENSVLVYTIQTQSPGSFWGIDPMSGRIFVNKPNNEGIKFTDGDIDGEFLLEVKVTDGKYDAISNVKITVNDINDNAPVFLPSFYEISINETTPGETLILQVTARDADDPTSDNGKLKYTILTGNTGGKFQLDEDEGKLYSSPGATFDYDKEKRYQLQAVVNDLGQPQLSGNATIIVHILDNNNKDPKIDPFLQEFDVYDNVPISYEVGTVRATDPDDDASLKFEWFGEREASSFEGYPVNPDTGYDFRELFTVDYDTGVIRVNQQLDSRRAAIVAYGIRVMDVTPAIPQYGPGRIVINIKPFNTQPPVFDPFPSPIIIDEEQPIGSVLISLIALDDNGIRIFEIQRQPDDRYFDVNPKTGSVSILNRIDYDDARRINDTYFVVTAIDTGEPELTATATVSVIFRNINDNFPEFQDPVRGTPVNIYQARIPENSPDGTPIGTAYAFDRDRPDNYTYDQVRYYMDDDRFDVDPITGQMFVRLRNGAVLDRESNPRINTRVIARDNPKGPADNQNQRAAAVQVVLTDMNDNCPRFTSIEYRVTIFETIGVGTDILQLFYTDRDIGNNAISFYTKVYGSGTDYDDFFDVRKEFGRVYVKKNLVRYTGNYMFYVEATDNLGTGCTINTTVVVTVNPSANAPPIWVIPPVDNMTIYVLEEQYKGMLVLDVFARDEDSGVNGVVDYSFIYNGEQLQATPEFKINKLTGVIQAEIIYDRERVDKYVLLLKARDRGETPLETTRFLTVVILDVNDNQPVFPEAYNEIDFQIDIKENRDPGDIEKIPSASDPDLNPIIVYDIISGNEDGVFELDRDTRMLRLLKPLDRESKGIYYMDVLASNDEPDYTVIQNRRRKRAVDPSILTVKVVVGDINDLAPTFLQEEYYGCVSARSPYDKHILTVEAVDRDAIGAGIVRYKIDAGNKIGNSTLFDIHPKFGVVTNKVLMRNYAGSMFYLTVNARDREDVETAESANTIAKIFVHSPGNEVKLLITQNTAEVRLYQTQIQSILEEAADLKYVCINDVQDHVVDSVGSVTTLWSDVYITGIRRTIENGEEKFSVLSNTEMKNIVDRERHDRKSDFDLLYIKEVEAASSSQEIELEDQAVLIILIIIAVLIFLVIIFCIIAFMCIRAAKRQKKALLLHKTHATPPAVIQPEPVVVEPVMYDNRAYVVEDREPVVVTEQRVVEPEPVHVQYAVVQKRAPSPQYAEDDQDAIVVELKDDEPRQQVVYEPDREYRIETEVVSGDQM